jgi:hypothetical protein
LVLGHIAVLVQRTAHAPAMQVPCAPISVHVVPSATSLDTGLPALHESVTQSFVEVGGFESSGTDDALPPVQTIC